MQLSLAYLNHYHANTKTDPNVKERVGWATVDVEIQDVPKAHLEQVFQDNDGYFAGFDSDKAYACDDHYWAIAEATNGVVGKRVTEKRNYHRGFGDDKGWPLANFDRSAQKAFAWAAFEFRLFSRAPAVGVYSTEPHNYRNYNPGTKVVWDDRPEIEARVKAYFERNLLASDNRIFCRIDRPCLHVEEDRYSYTREFIRVLTPYGGFGDPLIDFSEAYAAIDDIEKSRRDIHWSTQVKVSFNAIPDRGTEPLERLVRALLADLFSRWPWYNNDRKFRRTEKLTKTLSRLHEIWLANHHEMDDAALDEAAQLMMELTKEGGITSALQSWLDRPVSLWTTNDAAQPS